MINQSILDEFKSIDLNRDLKIQSGANTYDYNGEVYTRLKGVYDILKESLECISDDINQEFIKKTERSIQQFNSQIQTIKSSASSLGNDFENHKRGVIQSINRYIDEIYNNSDRDLLLITANHIRNQYFSQNSDKILKEKLGQMEKSYQEKIKKIEQENRKTLEEQKKEATKGVEDIQSKVQKVKEIGLSEFNNSIGKQIRKYNISKWIFLASAILLSSIIIYFLICIKKTFIFDDIKNFIIYDQYIKNITSYYALIKSMVINLAILSILTYLLKLSVDIFKQSSNILLNLRNKNNIMISYLLMRSDDDKGNTNQILTEKTTEYLYSTGDGTSFKNKGEDGLSVEKIIEILSNFKK